MGEKMDGINEEKSSSSVAAEDGGGGTNGPIQNEGGTGGRKEIGLTARRAQNETMEEEGGGGKADVGGEKVDEVFGRGKGPNFGFAISWIG
jgi:hypothetical protein